MNVSQLIRRKRDGLPLTREEIGDFVRQFTRGHIPDYQAAAWLMAVTIRGMGSRETADLTAAMLDSGERLDLSEFSRPKVDKHSTGGVGDKTSLVVAPAAAAAGLLVPMISGRGLGHTGGTLDKLESIPGFRTNLSLREFRRVLAVSGLGMIGQTEELVPADRKLYALRDATATVESLPLISASIMSKKLAEDIDGLVLDVKTGCGAFMKTIEESRRLAESMIEIGEARGKRVHALISNMDQPLGCSVGNALEVIECLETLKGRGPADLVELSRELTATMLVVGGVEQNLEPARARFDAAIASGAALEAFRRTIVAQGGNPRVVEDYALFPRAAYEQALVAPRDGVLQSLEAETIGRAALRLGAGRERLDSPIDPAVGLVFEKKVGEDVRAGERICAIHANRVALLDEARQTLLAAIKIVPQPANPRPLILGRVPKQAL